MFTLTPNFSPTVDPPVFTTIYRHIYCRPLWSEIEEMKSAKQDNTIYTVYTYISVLCTVYILYIHIYRYCIQYIYITLTGTGTLPVPVPRTEHDKLACLTYPDLLLIFARSGNKFHTNPAPCFLVKWRKIFMIQSYFCSQTPKSQRGFILYYST